jgi:prevent-host-death family protein
LTARQVLPRLTLEMPKTYSTYEAKAKLSELLDGVEKGDVVTITRRGEPVAEVRAVKAEEATALEERFAELRRRGVMSAPAAIRPETLKPLAKRKGALKRFLRSRD